MAVTIKDYLSPSLWKKRYEDQIKWAKEMNTEEKFDLLGQLHLMGVRLIEAKDKEKKLQFFQRKSMIDKERLKDFIRGQLKR